MANLRSVNTKFWEDPWVEKLTPEEKLLFLYLITNGYANLAGIYEITIKRICFETGLSIESIENGLEGFGKVRKAYFVNDNYIFLPNWLKNQNLNTNMKKGVVKIINELPKDVKINILGNGYQTIQKDYLTIRNTLLKYEVEVLEGEEESEDESILQNTLKNFQEIKKETLEAFSFIEQLQRESKLSEKKIIEFINKCFDEFEVCDDIYRTRKDYRTHILNKIKSKKDSAPETLNESFTNKPKGKHALDLS